MKSQSLLDEPFDTVVTLYKQKKLLEEERDLEGLALLQEQYPELFDAAILKTIENTLDLIRRKELSKKIIRVNFRELLDD